MVLCHQALSRSQLNAVAKLREAGIVPRNLVVLPSASDVSLANNGTHVSLGSRRLTTLVADPRSGFGAGHEKLLADLVVKIAEHFLPLFVGTYTAAPYRLDFADFHPEAALGFLSHELLTSPTCAWSGGGGRARPGTASSAARSRPSARRLSTARWRTSWVWPATGCRTSA